MGSKLRLLGILVIIIILGQWACVSGSGKIRLAHEMYNSGNFDQAIEFLQQAYQENPKNSETRLLLYRAKLSSYFQHLGQAREKKQLDEKEKAIKEYQKALAIFPDNFQLKNELNEYVNPELTIKTDARPSAIALPTTLNVDNKKIISINLTNHPIRNIFTELGDAAKINVVVDREFRDFPYSIKTESNFYDILNQLCMAAVAQYRILSANSIFIYNSDNSLKKNNIELRGIKVFYLSNIMAKDAKALLTQFFMSDMMQQVRIQEDVNLNALIVKADYNSLLDIEKLINNIDKEKNEIGIDIEIVEVNRTFLNKIGNEFNTNSFGVSAGIVGSDGKITQTVPFNSFSSIGGFLTLPSITLNILESDDKNKIIAKPNLRGVEGEEIKLIVGDEVPIPQTQLLAYATGGVNSIPQTTFTYKNVGVEVSITPYLHKNNEVTLKTKMTVQFVSGQVSFGQNDYPYFGKREVQNTIRLKEGETNIIAGLIRDDERNSLKGIPAFSEIPIIGRLFGSNTKTITQTDLIFAITPHILRKTQIEKYNTDVIWSNQNQPKTVEASNSAQIQQNRQIMPRRDSASERNSPVAIILSPSMSRIQAKGDVTISVFLQSASEINSLAINGSIQGGPCEITDIALDARSDMRTIKNFAGSSFDISYMANREHGISGNMPLGQIQLKLLEKGHYTISLQSINAVDSKMIPISVNSQPITIDVL